MAVNLAALGKRIREQREKRSLRQVDVANALMVTSQAVSKWERGENAPDISVLPELAKILGVTVDWLLGANTPDTDTFEATVLCTSINGYALRSAHMPPRDVALWVNGIYYDLTETVLRFDGVPVKYVGDGFLGFFAGTDHQQRALSAALKARELARNPGLVIALHSGDIYLGTIGHPDYARLDIIGETVNAAFLAMSWIAEHCKTGIGLTDAVARALPEGISLSRRRDITVLGAETPLTIYEPVGGE
jgi:class 3 adenylate cyclase